MSQDPNYKATTVILDDIEKHGLIQFNKQYCDEEFFKNFIKFQTSFSNSINKIVIKLDPFEKDYEDMIIFTVYSQLSFINSHFIIINLFLKIITNPDKLKGGFDENTTLSNMVKKICNKMQYPEKLKRSIRGLFLQDFRDAISNQQYIMDKKGFLVIYPKDPDLKKKLTVKNLADYSIQIMSIFEAMMDWADGNNSKNTKPEKMENIVYDLLNQIELLDKKLKNLS
ncbi:MAG: hypothetical protein K5790_03975 [Nitrosopumilus sp.]|uniref:hypothetical protein n=1 Tax=Nitrosopumilus sp. TaxID=2024843 RepID=UPI00247C2A20|nr:hypothetical protein [Nitrosopumilus sp.]MCV0392438.1 hypothetical protein [Nitrosopumilus sp.]